MQHQSNIFTINAHPWCSTPLNTGCPWNSYSAYLTSATWVKPRARNAFLEISPVASALAALKPRARASISERARMSEQRPRPRAAGDVVMIWTHLSIQLYHSTLPWTFISNAISMLFLWNHSLLLICNSCSSAARGANLWSSQLSITCWQTD